MGTLLDTGKLVQCDSSISILGLVPPIMCAKAMIQWISKTHCPYSHQERETKLHYFEFNSIQFFTFAALKCSQVWAQNMYKEVS